MNTLTASLFLAVCVPLGLPAQQGIGAQYGARDPKTCKSTSEPAKGAPSAEQAKQYFQCGAEKVGPGGNLYLVEKVQVQVGRGTPFLELDRGQRPGNADVNSLVYAIRGSFLSYQCAKPSSIMNNTGKNCNVYENAHASGQCFRTAFGDWSCNMVDFNATQNQKTGMPPPR